MKTVYLVEDDKDSAELAIELLSDEHEIKMFSNGGDLLAFLQNPNTIPPNIFILDISLPGMDGETLMRKIRDDIRYENIPTIALTAHAMKGDKQHYFDVYVSKPIVDEAILFNEIKRLINPD